MENEVILSQANALTESRYSWTKIEKNCMYKIIEKVRHDYIEQPTTEAVEGYKNMYVRFPASVLGEITDKDHTKEAHEALVNLRKRDVEVWEEDGSWFNTGFICSCKYNARKKEYTVEVSSMILPFLVDLARKYTSYSLTVAMTLRGVYSQRFYELCCQYRNNFDKEGYSGFHKTQKQLRQMFCLEDKYAKAPDFNSRVIMRAQKEIKEFFDKNQCDLWFDVNIKGRGMNQTYDFKIYTREQTKRQQEAAQDLQGKALYIYKRMLAIFKRDKKFCDRTYKHLDFNPELIQPLFDKITKWETKYKGNDLARIMRFALEEDFDIK